MNHLPITRLMDLTRPHHREAAWHQLAPPKPDLRAENLPGPFLRVPVTELPCRSVIHLGTIQYSHQRIAIIEEVPAALEDATGCTATHSFVGPDDFITGFFEAMLKLVHPILFSFREERTGKVDLYHSLMPIVEILMAHRGRNARC